MTNCRDARALQVGESGTDCWARFIRVVLCTPRTPIYSLSLSLSFSLFLSLSLSRSPFTAKIDSDAGKKKGAEGEWGAKIARQTGSAWFMAVYSLGVFK